MAEVLGGMTGALQGTVNNALNTGQSILDRFFPPEKRQELWALLSRLATEKPMMASFLLSQFAISGIPLGLFFVMTITVFVFALLAALLIGVLGALLFTVFCVGFALVILLPTLFITTFAAAFLWLWGVGLYYLIKWFNEKEIPGIHTGFKEGILKKLHDGKSTGEDVPALNGEAKGHHSPPKQDQSEPADKAKKPEKLPPKLNGVTKKVPAADKFGDVVKKAGVDVDDIGNVDEITKKADVGNVTKKADLGNVKNAAGGVTGGITGGLG